MSHPDAGTESVHGDYTGLEEVGPYRVIASLALGAPKRLILDTNVAVDIERFYFGGGQVDCPALRRLLKRFPAAATHRGRVRSSWDLQSEIDIIYGWAVAEATVTRTGVHDAARARRMQHALERVLRWDPDRVDREFENRHPPVNRDSQWPKIGLPVEDGVHHPSILIAPSYGALLYLCRLDATRAQWRNRSAGTVFDEYYGWLSDELGVRGAYEISAGVDFLVGSRQRKDKLRKMLKLGGSESADGLAEKAWNAAWDLQFLRAADGGTLGLWHSDDSKINTALVTRNIDPWLVRTQSRVRMVVEGKPYLHTWWDKGTRLTPDMVALLEPDLLADQSRSQREPDDRVRGMYAAIHEFEKELGVTQTTQLARDTPARSRDSS